jgi:hypothetical protein
VLEHCRERETNYLPSILGAFPSDRTPKAKKDETNLSFPTFPHVAIPLTYTNQVQYTTPANSKNVLKQIRISCTP